MRVSMSACARSTPRPASGRTRAKDVPKRLQRELHLIDDHFVNYLQGRHTSEFTIRLYRGFLRKVARYLSKRGRSVTRLRLGDVPRLMRGCLPDWKVASRKPRQAGLRQWLRFIGRFDPPIPPVRWQRWLDDYDHFLRVDRCLADCTRLTARHALNRYLTWQFRRRPMRWKKVKASDLHRYYERRCLVDRELA